MLTNSLLITALVLTIILVVPMLCKKIHLPAIVGLILSGIVVGPFGLGIIERTETIDFFGKIGILYIMFLSGIEIDMDGFQSCRTKSLVYGAITFFLPLAVGMAGGILLGMNPWSALLMASILGSHTLMTYPVVSRFGIQKNEAVNLVIGATVFAVTGAMLILAAVSSRFSGAQDMHFWLRLALGTIVMMIGIFWVMPRLARWFFHWYNDPVMEFLFVMVLAAAAGCLAHIAGLEPILGVFLAALALNRQIPNLSPLMNRINFVGNALFIPIFLLSVGMLIDVRVLAYGYGTIKMFTLMVGAGILMKWLAAWIAQKSMHLSRSQRQLMFGLTNAHAAGALATVMIGYAIVLPNGEHLLTEQVLNATIILILIACAVSSFITEHAAKQLSQEVVPDERLTADEMQLLIPVANPDSNHRLVQLSTILISRHPESAIHATAVCSTPEQLAHAERLLDDTARFASSIDYQLLLHRQVAVNIANGIRTVAEARSISHIVLGLPQCSEEPGFGSVADPLIPLVSQQLWLYHAAQSLHNIRQVRVLVPTNAEYEPDYAGWQILVERLVKSLSASVTQETVTDWTFLPRAAKRMDKDELYVIVQARMATPSYSSDMDKVGEMMRTCFRDRDYIILYPAQQVSGVQDNPLFMDYKRTGDSTYSLIQKLVQSKKK